MNKNNSFLQKLRGKSSVPDNTKITADTLERVMLVDTMNLVMRSFKAVPIANSEGNHVGLIYGAIDSLRKSISVVKPDRVILCWEGEGSHKRREKLFEGYKIRRATPPSKPTARFQFNSVEEESESLMKQLRIFRDMVSVLPVTEISVIGLEADDIIGYIASTAKAHDQKIIIHSTDRDYIQLVSESVNIYNPIRDLIISDPIARGLFTEGIAPINFVIARTIEGDKSDDIPGIKGIGVPSVVKMFPELKENKRYTLEEFRQLAEERVDKGVKFKSIVDNFNIIERNFSLMQLHNLSLSTSQISEIHSGFNKPIVIFNSSKLMIKFIKLSMTGLVTRIDNFNREFGRLSGIAVKRNALLKGTIN